MRSVLGSGRPPDAPSSDVGSELFGLGTSSRAIAMEYGELSASLKGVSGRLPPRLVGQYLALARVEFVLGSRLQRLGTEHAWDGVGGPAWGSEAPVGPIGRALCMRSAAAKEGVSRELAGDLSLFLGICSKEPVKLGDGLSRAGKERSAEDLSVWDVR